MSADSRIRTLLRKAGPGILPGVGWLMFIFMAAAAAFMLAGLLKAGPLEAPSVDSPGDRFYISPWRSEGGSIAL